MNPKIVTTLKAVTVIITVVATFMASILIFLTCVWPINDTMLPYMDGMDWVKDGLNRLEYGVVIGLSVSGLIYLFNKLLFVFVVKDRKTRFAEKVLFKSAGIMVGLSVLCSMYFIVCQPAF